MKGRLFAPRTWEEWQAVVDQTGWPDTEYIWTGQSLTIDNVSDSDTVANVDIFQDCQRDPLVDSMPATAKEWTNMGPHILVPA